VVINVTLQLLAFRWRENCYNEDRQGLRKSLTHGQFSGEQSADLQLNVISLTR
jgi:hypothetical protein